MHCVRHNQNTSCPQPIAYILMTTDAAADGLAIGCSWTDASFVFEHFQFTLVVFPDFLDELLAVLHRWTVCKRWTFVSGTQSEDTGMMRHKPFSVVDECVSNTLRSLNGEDFPFVRYDGKIGII